MNHNRQNINHKQSGFTLIELMIVIAIVGILGAIAYPSYQESVRTSRRADAISALLEEAHRAERLFATTGSYATFDVASATSEDLFYAISEVSDATSFTITAAPNALGGQNSDTCGSFTLNNTNTKGVTGSGATVDDCW